MFESRSDEIYVVAMDESIISRILWMLISHVLQLAQSNLTFSITGKKELLQTNVLHRNNRAVGRILGEEFVFHMEVTIKNLESIQTRDVSKIIYYTMIYNIK